MAPIVPRRWKGFSSQKQTKESCLWSKFSTTRNIPFNNEIKKWRSHKIISAPSIYPFCVKEINNKIHHCSRGKSTNEMQTARPAAAWHRVLEQSMCVWGWCECWWRENWVSVLSCCDIFDQRSHCWLMQRRGEVKDNHAQNMCTYIYVWIYLYK